MPAPSRPEGFNLYSAHLSGQRLGTGTNQEWRAGCREQGYAPQRGDVVVFAGSDANPHGHIAIYDGGHWVSDFRQRNMSPYRTGAPPSVIYRFPDN